MTFGQTSVLGLWALSGTPGPTSWSNTVMTPVMPSISKTCQAVSLFPLAGFPNCRTMRPSLSLRMIARSPAAVLLSSSFQYSYVPGSSWKIVAISEPDVCTSPLMQANGYPTSQVETAAVQSKKMNGNGPVAALPG